MRSTRSRSFRLFCCRLAVLSLFAGAAQAREEQVRFMLDFGTRWQGDLRGSSDLYRSQLDYGEGPKLFAGNLFIAAPPGANRFVDRFELRMNSWGGEPYNTAQLRAVKAGVYELRFDYQNARYFNAIPSFANPFFGEGNLQTQHKYDISQRVARLQLTLWPQKRIAPFLAYQHSARQGPVRTTLAADGQDEFLLRSDVETGSQDFQFGANVRLSKFSLLLEQGFRWYHDDTRLEASGLQTGNSTRRIFGRDITLESYRGITGASATVPFSTGVAAYQPAEWLSLRGKVTYSNADLDSDFSEQFAGTLFSLPLATFYKGGSRETSGTAQQPNLFGDFSVEWRPVERFQIVERLSIRRFHISGSALADATLLQAEPLLEQGILERLQTSTPYHTFLSMDLDTQELQGFVYVTPRLMLRLGHRRERKEVKIDQRLKLHRNVLISGFAYDFSARNSIAGEYEFGHTDQPVLRTDTVDFRRVRLRGRLSPAESLQVRGNFTLFDNDADPQAIDFKWRSRNYSLQLDYTPVRRVSLSVEYERSSIQSNILFIIPQIFLPGRSIYRERGDYAGLFLSLLLPAKATLSMGYSLLGTVGNFPLNYHQPSASLEVPLGERLVAYGRWNFYDYNEKLSLFPQDYGIHLAVFGLRLTLDKK
ncbi:MAG: hypothetical protein HYX74_05105 [Acidobacteria bacterium]|nr:hypothetical protein [Acidobacteriota bacterium]